jgi:hypothetical protein
MRLMDISHAVHRSLAHAGFRIPRFIRRPLSRFLEGG